MPPFFEDLRNIAKFDLLLFRGCWHLQSLDTSLTTRITLGTGHIENSERNSLDNDCLIGSLS